MMNVGPPDRRFPRRKNRSEEHTSELQSRLHLVCRLLLETKQHTSEPQSPLHLACRLLLEKKTRLRSAPGQLRPTCARRPCTRSKTAFQSTRSLAALPLAI